MANLGKKGDIFCIRFRYSGKEYKKSLKTRNPGAADAARHLIELTIHRLLTGQTVIPPSVDPGDFILSGGTLQKPVEPPVKAVAPPSTRKLTDEYCDQKPLMAPSYHYSQRMHLRHLVRHLGTRADLPCDQISFRDLDRYLKTRLADRHPNTAERERVTFMQFYKWVLKQGMLTVSPTCGGGMKSYFCQPQVVFGGGVRFSCLQRSRSRIVVIVSPQNETVVARLHPCAPTSTLPPTWSMVLTRASR
jgi:hypothetical protein